jgi:hypothetical protein
VLISSTQRQMLLKNKKKREEATERTSLDLVGYSHTRQ